MVRPDKKIIFAAIVCLVVVAGCDGDGDSDKTPASASGGEPLALGVTPLSLPEEAPMQFKRSYQQAQQATTPAGVAQFALMSEMIGQKLSLSGDDRGAGFFKQAATLIRKAKEAGAQVDDASFSRLLYFEARVLAKEGSTECIQIMLEESAAAGRLDRDCGGSSGGRTPCHERSRLGSVRQPCPCKVLVYCRDNRPSS